MSVADYPDDKLLERAVKSARGLAYRKGKKHYRLIRPRLDLFDATL